MRCHALDRFSRTAGISDAPAGHGIIFRETSQQDGAAADGLIQRRETDVLLIIYQPVVDFVRDDDQVVFFGHFCHLGKTWREATAPVGLLG